MIELESAPEDRKKLFRCSTCPTDVQTLRRCREDREDFTDKDGTIWPMYVAKGGEFYSYCPAKATWDNSVVSIYQMLLVSAETGAMYDSGGISAQPSWWIEMLSWFLPIYRDKIFWSRAKVIMGSMSGTAGKQEVAADGDKGRRPSR